MVKGFTLGIVTGTILGAAMGMMVDPVNDRQHKKMSQQKNRLFRTMGCAIDNMLDTMKM